MDTGEKITLEVVLDGESKTYETGSYYNNDYAYKGNVTVDFPPNNYRLVSATEGAKPGVLVVKSTSTPLSGKVDVSLTGKANRIELESVETKVCEVTPEPDYEGLKARLTAMVEAEEFDEKQGTPRLTSGLDYLSGISKFDNTSDRMIYTVEIPEDGEYDLAFRYAVWQEPLPERLIEIDGQLCVFTLPSTGGWGGTGPDDFKGCVVDTNLHLTAGKHTFRLGVFKDGSYWNFDWIGFIKQ